MAKEIELTQGMVALVDDADYDWLSQWDWFYSGSGYAARWEYVNDERTLVAMHRLLCESEAVVDHINRNRLDNRRTNLRPATILQNLANRPGWGEVAYKGVERCGEHSWRARIETDGRKYDLGTYESAEQAARVYDSAARWLWGEYAFTNFPGTERCNPEDLPGLRVMPSASGTSAYRGVSFDRLTQKWRAQISVGNRTFYLGVFPDAEAAARAYDDAAYIHHGRRAKLNFPKELER